METTIPGRWALTMSTPIGRIDAELVFTADGGELSGVASGKGETVPLGNIEVHHGIDGERVIWRQAITKPMRLNLDFDVLVVGDELTGYSRAGRLPKSTVTGHRVRDQSV